MKATYTINFTTRARKQTQKLHKRIQNKFQKQLLVLSGNLKHPSLRIRKMPGSDHFEARIDYHYRFTFEIVDTDEESEINILSVGPHDEGLGKK